MTRIISVHVPKAGGSTMLRLLKDNYGDAHVFMDYADEPLSPTSMCNFDPHGWDMTRPRHLPCGKSVVHGHFPARKYDLVDGALRICFLRHPIDNLISIYRYWRKIPDQGHNLQRYFLKEGLGLLDFAQLAPLRQLYTRSFFGDFDMGKMDFIGCHENRVRDLARLSDFLGQPFDPWLHLNATEPNAADEQKRAFFSDAKLIAKLTDIVADDIAFYERHVG